MAATSDLIKVEISAETSEQADVILNGLLKEKLVTGGQIISAPARFWWKGEIIDMPYVTITSFTIPAHQERITAVVEQLSQEEVPMVSFIPFEGNKKLKDWVSATVSQ